jgi:cyclophilin family peptidyl-prolyl cis-trans isomerase
MAHVEETATVVCGTTKGDLELELHRAWSPHGYDRAVDLFERGYYDHTHFFRAVPNFLVQFGITYSADPNLIQLGRSTIPDDPQLPHKIPFEPGTISFAGGGPNSRTSQLFIAYRGASSFGQELWETPIGKVVGGFEHALDFYSYGDMPPWGAGPVQGKIHGGREYIDQEFPKIDSFTTCSVQRFAPENASAEKAALQSGNGASEPVDASQRELRGALAESADTHERLAQATESEPESTLTFLVDKQNIHASLGGALVVLGLVFLLLMQKGNKKFASKAL